MERITPFDIVVVLGLAGAFILGYAQGVIRRLLGIAALLFSLVLGSYLRPSLGAYLANEWTSIGDAYSFMVAFGAVFAATWITLSIGIQITYRPAPLFQKYPVLDEILGGLLGVLEGILLLIAVVLILYPYYTSPAAQEGASVGEFTLLRSVYDGLKGSVTGDILQHSLVPAVLSIFGFMFGQDIRDTFRVALARIASR